MKESKKQTDTMYHLLQLAMIVAAVIYLSITEDKFQKRKLARYYNISNPTLAKWVKYFTEYNYSTWPKKRKITGKEYLILIYQLGIDQEFVMNKSEMCDRFATDNKYLRKIISEKGRRIGLSANVWNECNIYPPSKTVEIEKLLNTRNFNP